MRGKSRDGPRRKTLGKLEAPSTSNEALAVWQFHHHMAFPHLRKTRLMAMIASELNGETTVPTALAGPDQGADENAKKILSSPSDSQLGYRGAYVNPRCLARCVMLLALRPVDSTSLRLISPA